MDVWKRKGRKAKPWVADYIDANGKRHRLSAETKERALELLAQKRREARDTGPGTQNVGLTVLAYVEAWQRRIETELKYASVRSYRYVLQTHIIPSFGEMKLRDLAPLHVKWLISEKRHAGLAKTTIRLIRGILCAMLNDAVDDGVLTRNPAQSLGRRKKAETMSQIERDESIRPLSEEEVVSLLAAAPDHESRTLLRLLARAGLRPGEAIALQWTDLNFSAREILVERNLYEGHLGTPKTGRRRRVDMSQGLALDLSRLYAQREAEKLAGRWTRDIPAWIFCQLDGEPLRIQHVRSIFDRSLRRAGLSGHVTYDLRHTFATTLLAKGTPLTYVAEQMGHKKPITTLTYYAHWIPTTSDKSFVDSLDQPKLQSFGTTFGTTREKVQYLQGNLPENNLNNC
ncbi:MAG TPA: site-specific integrase [Candidatus Binataceae bacterium]|nr:site-specific integrase [Candidatus Binataceae bacterium]